MTVRLARAWALPPLSTLALLLAGVFPGKAQAQAPPADEFHIRFIFGSEKEDWLKAVTEDFHRARNRTDDQKLIKIDLVPMGSGKVIEEAIEAIRNPDRTDIPRPHLISPASVMYLRLADQELPGAVDGQVLVGPTDSLVRSPVVIAMWKDMAELLGYGQGADSMPGWAEILALIKLKEGWGKYDMEEFGAFKFGQTNPEYSYSGLAALIAQVYAAQSPPKRTGLTVEDVRKPSTRDFLSGISRSISRYGDSTGFFGKEMIAREQNELHAAVLYENMVISSYKPDGTSKAKPKVPLVAIYPKEGTFWSDHPIGVVNDNGKWMTGEHRRAAEVYRRFLLEQAQQQRAMTFGFRPGDVTIKLNEKFTERFGVDPKEPPLLEVPRLDVIQEIRSLWRTIKKKADIVLVLDASNSMAVGGKFTNAKRSAEQLPGVLGDVDRLSLLAFGSSTAWGPRDLVMGKERAQAVAAIEGLKLMGNTVLYDAIREAHASLLKDAGPDRISVLIVLTDGVDHTSQIDLDTLKASMRFDPNRPIYVCTIGYGNNANPVILKELADLGRGVYKQSNPSDIKEIMDLISAIASAGRPIPSQAR